MPRGRSYGGVLGIALDSARAFAFVSTGAGWLLRVELQTFRVVDELALVDAATSPVAALALPPATARAAGARASPRRRRRCGRRCAVETLTVLVCCNNYVSLPRARNALPSRIYQSRKSRRAPGQFAIRSRWLRERPK